MKGKVLVLLIALLSITGLVYAGCSGTTNPIEAPEVNGVRIADNGEPQLCGVPQDCILTGGQTIEVGTVTIGNDEDTLYVTYTTSGGWVIVETHTHVATSEDGIPMNKNGNPIPGHFDYSSSHFPGVTEYTEEIDISGYSEGDTLYIATHAVVELYDDAGNLIQQETAWCGDQDFPGNRWGWYSLYDIQGCCCELSIPTEDITACYVYPNTPDSYWGITLSGVPDGYSVTNTSYNGWCVEQFVFLTPGCHTVNLWSTVDPNLPGFLQDPDFDMVNWILNHKDMCPGADVFDIQAAIWFFVDGGIYPDDEDAQCLVDNALSLGEGYCPGDGEIIAVILEAGDTKQETIIEVTCED